MKKVFILLLIIGSFTSCREDPIRCESELPCFEVEQNNFLACFLNGNPWIAGNERNLNGIVGYSAFLLNDQRFLLHGARINDEDYTIFDIVFHDVDGLGYATNIDTSQYKDLQSFNSPCVQNGFGRDYRINPDYNNYLELVEIDTLTNDSPYGYNGYRGHFGVQFINQSCRDTITMTEGIFKIGYKG